MDRHGCHLSSGTHNEILHCDKSAKIAHYCTLKLSEMNRILITGASSGLGEALARHYAAPGRRLILWARDQQRLENVAAACREAGAEACIRSLDLMDVEAAIAAARADDQEDVIDLALLCAGLGDVRPAGVAVEDPALVHRLGIVNFVAACAIATALGERMATRRRGGIVFIGSAASFHALPFAAAYAGSKAGLARFASALRIGLAEHGIRVTLISPGFIDTAAGQRASAPRPFEMRSADVASRIAKAAARGQAHLVLPWPFAWLRIFDRLLPRSWRDRLLLRLAP